MGWERVGTAMVSHPGAIPCWQKGDKALSGFIFSLCGVFDL